MLGKFKEGARTHILYYYIFFLSVTSQHKQNHAWSRVTNDREIQRPVSKEDGHWCWVAWIAGKPRTRKQLLLQKSWLSSSDPTGRSPGHIYLGTSNFFLKKAYVYGNYQSTVTYCDQCIYNMQTGISRSQTTSHLALPQLLLCSILVSTCLESGWNTVKGSVNNENC